jgi:NSS family neurotransmitter:Na+ symporter
MIEVPAAALMRALRFSRARATLAVGALAFAAGVPSALADSALAGVRVFGVNVLEAIDRTSSNVLLPLGGLAVALAVGWAWPRERAVAAAGLPSRRTAGIWLFALRFLVPAAIGAVFVWAAVRR